MAHSQRYFERGPCTGGAKVADWGGGRKKAGGDTSPPFYMLKEALKTSQQNNLYFDMSWQTQDKLYRAVCFLPEKHQQCKATSESSSPIKLTKYQLKRNALTDQEEVHVNKRSRLFEPDSHKINFDIQQLEPVEQKKSVEMTASEVLIRPANSGRIIFQGPEETIISKGKTLRKQEALFTDNTASVRLVLWENDIDKTTMGNCTTCPTL